MSARLICVLLWEGLRPALQANAQLDLWWDGGYRNKVLNVGQTTGQR